MDVRADIGRLERLSTMPDLLLRILDVVRNERASRQELTAVVERDQSLAHRIVAAANSAYFGHPGRVDSLEQAILLLGVELVKNLGLGMTVIAGFCRHGDDRARRLWTHAFDVAVVASELGALVSVTVPGICFLAGLLHDVGRAVLLSLYPDLYGGLIGGPELRVREKTLFGLDHSGVGALFLDKVPFPGEIREAVAHHHDPENAASDHGVVMAVGLAESLAARSGRCDDGADGEWNEEAATRVRRLGLGEGDIQAVEAALLAHGPEMELYFGV